MRPRLRQGRIVARRSLLLARHECGLPCVVWCQARPSLRVSVRAISGTGGEDEDDDDDCDDSEDELALQGDAEAVLDAHWNSGLKETDWNTP